MENVTEKPKRGRPRSTPPDWDLIMRRVGQTGTPRTLVNFYYTSRAMAVLNLKSIPEDDPLRWLYDPTLAAHNERAGFKQTILSELGRIPDDQLLRAVALQVCELKPKTRDAIIMIRRLRVGEGKPKPDQLETEIIHLIDNFRMRYPSTSWYDVFEALASVREAVTICMDSEK